MRPTWVLSAPDGPHVGPMNLAIRVHHSFGFATSYNTFQWYTSLQQALQWQGYISNQFSNRNVLQWLCVSELLMIGLPMLNYMMCGMLQTCIVMTTPRLTHWGRDKMVAISHTILSNAFSGIEIIKFWLKISLKFVFKGANNNIPALIQIMAWRQTGDKPLSKLMMVRLQTNRCVNRPQWVDDIKHWSQIRLPLICFAGIASTCYS